MKNNNSSIFYFLLILSLCLFSEANSQNSVKLRRSFIDSIKNCVSITGQFIVDKAHKKPNAGAKDGDMHIAGRNKQVGLPTVAEIMNAIDYTDAVDIVHNSEGTDNSVKMTGVWRLWFEHPHGSQIQKEISKKFKTTNPDHIFEIHPILKIEGIDLTSSLKHIDGFKPKDAATAFKTYSNAKCKISSDDNFITLDSKKIGYNYVEFKIIIQSSIDKVTDGSIITADVLTKRGKLVTEGIRMVFPKNSEAETELKKLGKGDEMHLLGIPRVNLDEISKQVEENSGKFQISLPYEMIIVSVY